MLGLFSKNPQWDISSIPDLTGRVAVVTGGNTGIGFVTCRELARKGARVYMLCRTESRALAAIEKIKQELGPGLDPKVQYINFDLQILKTGKQAAEEVMKEETRLDILINNAGLMATPYELGPDGIETQACNGTGHFALTVALLPLLKQTAALPDSHVRIVNVTSMGYLIARVLTPDFSSLERLNQKTWLTMGRYGLSKLTNILLTNELQKRLEQDNIYCVSVHPGVVATELYRGPEHTWPYLTPLVRLFTKFLLTPEKGALTQLYAATSLEVEEKNLRAALLIPFGKTLGKASVAEDKNGRLGGQFWDLCEALVKQKT